MPDTGESATARRKIWPIHEIGEADGLHFIVSEYVTGQSLRDHDVLYFT